MYTESRQGPLPLAEAMVAWSDPALVDAIRAAEDAVPPDELRWAQRYSLADLTTQRWPPQRSRVFVHSEAIGQLDRAWDVLFAHFRLRPELGEISLKGVLAAQSSEGALDLLLPGLAASDAFDPAAGAVFVGPHTYLRVQATLRVSTSAARFGASRKDLDEPGPTDESDDTGRQTLLGALLNWCDDSLVQAVRDRERKHTEHDLSSLRRGYISRPEDLRQPMEKEWMLGPPDFTLLLEAWKRLERDFERRVTAERFFLTGVQIKPALMASPQLIPGVWASACRFDFAKGTVIIADREFVAVTAWLERPDPGSPGAQTSRVDLADPSDTPLIDEVEGSDIRGRRGRGPHAASIRAAVGGAWDSIQRRVKSDGGARNWSEMARIVERQQKAMRAKDGVTVVSQFHTIRRQLRVIYPEMLTEKAEQN